MIQIEQLVKYYGDYLAVDGVSFQVERGEILGFLGPNGAGKSTTMNILTGFISATSGKVTVDGYDILEEPQKVKSRIGYLPERPPLYDEMTIDEYLRFVSRLKGIPKSEMRDSIDHVLEVVRIRDLRHRLIGNLSKGYRQRVGLAQALLGKPEVLILDEPTSGLDPKQIIEIRNLIRDLGKEHTVILSSHILSEVQEICNRVLIINKGKIVADEAIGVEHPSFAPCEELELSVEAPAKQVQTRLRQVPGVRNIELLNTTIAQDGATFFNGEVTFEKGHDARREIFYELSREGWPILQMTPLNVGLEDIFLKVTASDYDPERDGSISLPVRDATEAQADPSLTDEVEAEEAHNSSDADAANENGGLA